MKVSIVIPLYNKAQSIKQTIECIQAQTYQNWEIVIVDGYSQDGSLEIAQEMAAADARIHIHMQENRRGVTPARNESVMHAQYEHIVFMDADDWIEADMLEQLYNLAEKYQADVANCVLQEEIPEVAQEAQIPVIKEKRDIKITHYDNRIESGLAMLAVWGPVCKLYRKSVIEHIQFENYKVAEDLLFNTNVICSEAFSKVATIYYPFYHYVIYPIPFGSFY